MKSIYIILAFAVLLISEKLSAQSTFVRTIQYNSSTIYGRKDTLEVGPMGIVPTKNGHFVVLNFDNEDGDQSICDFNPNGGFSRSVVGNYMTLQYWRASNLRSTPDSGYSYIRYYNNFGGTTGEEYYLMKGSNIVHTWYHNQNVQDVLYDAIPNYHSGYYCNVNGVWIDYPTGDTVNLNYVIIIFSNDDFLLAGGSLTRQDTSGNIVWTTPLNGYSFACNSNDFIYVIKDSLRKYDAHTGSLLWTREKYSSGSYCYLNSTEGMAILNGRHITILDSSGNFVDSNNINLPLHQFNSLASLYDGSIITGGSFISGQRYLGTQDQGYSSMIIKLNDLGHGTIDSINYYYNGDAWNDGCLSFEGDAVVIAAAFGNSNGHPDINGYSNYYNVFYSPDWSDSFQSGLNYKYCDLNGDGIINTTDMGYIGNSNDFCSYLNPSGEVVKVLLDNNSPAVDDTFNVYIVLGDVLNPVDSIYGISLKVYSTGPLSIAAVNFEVKNNVIGDTATNLYFYYQGSKAVICRTDHKDTIVSGDTIMKARVRINYMVASPPYYVHVGGHMLSKNGYTIPISVAPAVISTIVNVNEENNSKEINLFPQPATGKLIITSASIVDGIQIIDLSGRTLFSESMSSDNFELNVENYSPGIYFIKSEINGACYFKKFLVQK